MHKPTRSPEFNHYCRTLRCPNGHRRSLTYVEGSGKIITNLWIRDRLLLEHPMNKLEDQVRSMRAFAWLHEKNHELMGGVGIRRFRVDSAIECEACGERWPVFLPGKRNFKIVGQSEPRRVTTLLGVDERKLDNRESETEARFLERFERVWTQRIEIGWEHTTTQSDSAKGSVSWSIGPTSLGAGVEQRLEEVIRARFSSTSEERTKTEKEVDILVPGRTQLSLRTTWKQVWSEVEYHVQLFDDDVIARIPLRIAVDVIADQQVIQG